MSVKASKYSHADVEIIGRVNAFSGFFKITEYELKHRLFGGGWGKAIKREVFQRGDASAAIIYDPVNDLLGLIEQFRIGALDSELGPWCLEVVAGMVEDGESPDQLVKRELNEEAGISRSELVHITSYYSTPGGCSEKIHLFAALCNLSQAGGDFGLETENEDIRFHVLDPDEVFTTMYQNRTNNAATLIGLQWLQMNREQLREQHGREQRRPEQCRP